jgi:aminopeptidase 2
MDQIAIPDFNAGAMENWGLVTYRSVALLLDEETSGAAQKERVAEVVQHELAHQWFGNLVTMDFWDGLWLNEGFATWMSWYSCNIFYPEWKVWQGYVTDSLASALSLDSMRSSHPIEVPVKRADEINEIFDAISYSKGSAVIRMISKYLGEDVFMEGIRRYLKKHAYGNTRTEDLWAALSEASGKPVEKVMDIWTKNMGYPVVTVTENDDKHIHVKQNRFLKTGDATAEDDKVLYPVFLGLRTKKGVQEDLLMLSREDNFPKPEDDFFKVNADHSGLYRTSYTPERLEKLGKAAKEGLLSVEDRAGMIADAGALSSAGYAKTSSIFTLLKNFDTETEFVVWSEMLTRIANVRSVWTFEDQKTQDALKAFQRDIVSQKAHTKGWKFSASEDHVEAQFKALLFGSAGNSGDAEVIKAAQSMFKAFAEGDRKAIHPNLRGSVYGIALMNGGEAEYEILLNEYKTTKDADERNTALRSLGRTDNPKLIQRTIDFALSDDVKFQDIYLPLVMLRMTAAGVNANWEWLQKNWETIKERCPPGLPMLGGLVYGATMGFTSWEKKKEVEAFFKDKDTKGYQRNLSQALEQIESRTMWLERDRADVKEYLVKSGYLKEEKL